MKKFHFPLDTLMTLRKRQEDDTKRMFAQSMRDLAQLEESRNILSAQAADVRRQINDKVSVGVTGSLLQEYHRFHWQLGLDTLYIGRDILKAKDTLESRRLQMIEAGKKLKSVEMLKDRKRQVWKKEIEQEDQKVMDEIGVTAFIRSQSESRSDHGGVVMMLVLSVLAVSAVLGGIIYSGLLPSKYVAMPFDRYFKNQLDSRIRNAHRQELWMLEKAKERRPSLKPDEDVISGTTSVTNLTAYSLELAQKRLHDQQLQLESDRKILEREKSHMTRNLQIAAQLHKEINAARTDLIALQNTINNKVTEIYLSKIQEYLAILKNQKPKIAAEILLVTAKTGEEDMNLIVDVLYKADPKIAGPILDAMGREEGPNREISAEIVKRILSVRGDLSKFMIAPNKKGKPA